MSTVQGTDQAVTGVARGWRLRRCGFALLLVFAVACGGSDSSDAGSQATTASESAADEPPSDEPAADESPSSEPTGGSSEVSVRVQPVDLPAGLQLFDRANQTATLNGVAYLVTGRSESMRLIAVTEDGARETDAVIAGARFAEVFNSGTRIVMTGSDEAGDLVVLSSKDGVTFSEVRIPVPQRYVEADVWQATSLIANTSDVADLGDDMYLVARLGISWPRTITLVQDYAYTVSFEDGEAASRATTIRQTPQDDGDVLFTFEREGAVVFEALGSEAGIVPEYEAAYNEARDGETGFYGSWIISESGAVQSSNPPLDGGLEADLRLRDLYPVGDGVAALVTDFSPDARAPQQSISSGGIGLFASGVVVRYQSEWQHDIRHTWDGEVWESIGDPVGQGNGPAPRVIVDVTSETYAMFYDADGMLVFLGSDDGLGWDVPKWTIDVGIPGGGRVEIQPVGGEYIILWHPFGEEDEFRAFSMVPGEDGGDMDVVEIDLDPDPPTITWIDDDPTDLPESVIPELSSPDAKDLLSWSIEVKIQGDEDFKSTALFFGDLLTGD